MTRDLLPRYLGWVALTGLLAVAGAYFIPQEMSGRLAAFLGVTEATFSSAASLSLKKWALSKSIRAALGMIGIVFGLRLVLAVAGLAYVRVKSGAVVPFIAGFFGVYFVLQWVEISYVLAESKRMSGD